MGRDQVRGRSNAWLLERYKPMLKSIVGRLGVPDDLRDDAMQEASLALLAARKGFDPTRAGFQTRAWRLVWTRVREYCFKARNPYGYSGSFYEKELKAGADLGSTQFDERLHGQAACESAPSGDEADEMRARVVGGFCAALNLQCTPAERDMLVDWYVGGVPYREVLAKHGNAARRLRDVDVGPIIDRLRREEKCFRPS